jgi:ribose 5-phosphate isomerase A
MPEFNFRRSIVAGGETSAVPLSNDPPKVRAAHAAAALVRDGMTVGLGSGSTSTLMIRRLGERVAQENLKITAASTSEDSTRLASSLGIPVRDLDDLPDLDINLDGADEIDPKFRMIKGLGGALLREKILALASNHRVTIVDISKRVEILGIHVPLPVEVSSIGLKHTERRLQQLGCSTSIRLRDGSVYKTDGGNMIVDCTFGPIQDPESLDRELQCLAGVLDTGFFIGLCDTLIVGSESGVDQIESGVRPRPDRLKSQGAT